MIDCRLFTMTVVFLFGSISVAQVPEAPNRKHIDSEDPFAQLDPWWPTPGQTRIASGAPGPNYWQQRCDYEIDVTLDDKNQRIVGNAELTYHNLSPHSLNYLWVQLDQNRFRREARGHQSTTASRLAPKVSFREMKSILAREEFDGGFRLRRVTDASGERIEHTVVGTMMRIDLGSPLLPGEKKKW